jgi:hypothetical protein
MKVELYLKNINQEMIDAGRKVKHGTGLDWMVSWPKECCILDFGMLDRDLGDPAKRGYLLRQEKDGGMFWDPRTGSVYKVDEEAYHAMIELDRGFTEKEVARRMKVPITRVKSFIKQLNEIIK